MGNWEKKKNLYFQVDGAKLKKARGALSQRDAGARVGIDHSKIGAFERGERVPSFETFRKLLEVYGVNAEDVICDEHLEEFKSLARDFYECNKEGIEEEMRNGTLRRPRGL